jgi:hypothetical protein
MKAAALTAVLASLAIVAVPEVAWAGVTPGAVPEPTALLVWLGLVGAGALFYSRRNRQS